MSLGGETNTKHFVNKKIKYVWDGGARTFTKLRNVDEFMRQGDFYRGADQGLDRMGVADRIQEYGENMIKISVPPVLYLVFHEVLTVHIVQCSVVGIVQRSSLNGIECVYLYNSMPIP